MSGKEPGRNLGSRRLAGVVLALAVGAGDRLPFGPDDEPLGLGAAEAESQERTGRACTDFVEKTRPDPEGMSYLPPAVPHKVSPLAVKTAAEIQAKKDALDAAQERQTNPGAPVPLQVAKAKRPVKAKPDAADVPD